MKPAVSTKRHFEKTKMMMINGSLPTKITHGIVADLETFLKPGDLLIVNTASTLPSSFRGKIRRSAEDIEIRLSAFIGTASSDLSRWSAISFGGGDWRMRTEQRGRPPLLNEGDVVDVSDQLSATIKRVDARSARLLEVEFNSQNLLRDLFKEGRPIQYSHQEKELAVWDQQTIFNGPPVSVEPPSAAFPMTWSLLLKLKARGVAIMPIIHSAGISSAGEAELDARLPLAEYFEVSQRTVDKIRQTHRESGRVVALGTSVTRAIESAIAMNRNAGLTSLKLGPDSRVRGIDVFITGMHEEGSSHAELMRTFCDVDIPKLAQDEATRNDYLSHEFGDLTLLYCPR